MSVTAPVTRPAARELSRRGLLAGLLLAPPVLAACSLGGAGRSATPDPLVALADAARADAALAAAAIAAAPALRDSVEPLRVARTEHAAALDAEIARLDPDRTAAPTVTATPVAGRPPTTEQVRAAVTASGNAAASAALDLPAERVGLAASVAACCAAYAAVLR